ncbi:type VI secretion system Vgr family protein [Paraburkholderia sp. J7]|uniref:type VI secretion system Vgr family protein n=1 Tax=Paraburkholderia sp. J7 TaxID=2805438 RepID=UPI002AB6513D|nr:type VI secretion system tip protein TssI/VgrG [Paraburkholderia sp. J7]
MNNENLGSYRKPEHTLMIGGANLPTWTLVRYNAIGQRERVERPLLVPVSVEGVEGVGMLFRYEVLCRTSVESLELGASMPAFDHNALVGKDVTLYIDIPGKGEFVPGMPGDTGRGNRGFHVREINGHVTQAEFLREDARSRVYRFVIEPPFAQARLGQDYRFFKECTVLDVLEELMGRYTSYELRIDGPLILKHYPTRDLIRQHFESDFAFFSRLCEHYGIFYWFEHRKGGCVMILADSLGAFHPHGEAYDSISYAPDNRFDEEHIDRLDVASRVTEGKVTAVDHDPQRPRLGKNVEPLREEEEDPRDTTGADQEFFAYANVSQPLQGATGLSATPNDVEAETHFAALVRMQALRCVGLRGNGHGNMRGMLPGFTFHLTGYPLDEVNTEYLVLCTKLTLVEVGQVSGTAQEFRCETEFEIQPANEYYRMPLETPLPMVVTERAIVTGPDGHIIWTDAQGRIRLQPVPDRKGNFDEDSFIWVTPLQQWQNGQLGTFAVPRIGSEVVLGYINGNPDMPVMLGSLVNAHNLPGWELPHNQWLSGMRSRMDGSLASNHLALDDTRDKQQAQLASDHGKSSLSLGYNTRIDGNKGRQDARGEGFELRTDLWGVVRAAMGLLLTSFTRGKAAGKVKEIAEMLARLTAARGLHQDMAQLALQHGAQDSTSNQNDVANAIKSANSALRGNGGADTHDFPEFENPDIAISSAANLHASAEQMTHIVSGTHTAFSAGGDISFSTGRSYHASVRGSVSLFSYQLGMKFIAAKGPWIAQAQSGPMSLAALQDVTISSSNGRVVTTARDEVWIGAGGSYIQINGSGIINGSPGPILEKTPSWDAPPASSMKMPLPVMPVTPLEQNPAELFTQRFDVSTVAENFGDGQSVADQPYRIFLPDGTLKQQGMLTNGQTLTVSTAEATKVRCEIGAGDWQVAEDSYDHHELASDIEQA